MPGIPVIGNALAMAKDPAKFFVDCYRKHGPVFRIQILGNTYTVLAGAEAATFMGTRQGWIRCAQRSSGRDSSMNGAPGAP